MRSLNFSILCLFFVHLVLAEREGRISGGADAERGQFPYHVKIEAFDGKTIRLCGGALISKEYILTAAHCIYTSADIILRFGTINRLEGPVSAVRRITDREYIKIHENYTDSPLAYDLALLYIPNHESLLPDDYTDVVALPSSDETETDLTGLPGNVTGFGLKNDDDSPLLAMKLQYVQVPVISDDECRQFHGQSVNPVDKFCTNGTYGSTCVGDEGAPFVTELNGKHYLVGVGSLALTMCTRGFPPVFTNILPHLDWIEENISDPPPTTPVPPPGDNGNNGDKCNCVCRCYTCPAEWEPPTTVAASDFNRRWFQK